MSVSAWNEVITPFGAKILPQPEDTIADTGLSDGRFRSGARGLWGEDDENRDATHLNVDYGKIILAQINDALRDLRAPASASSA
ncbi:hypothetical protein [Cognatiyoonia koreensis]|uniref:hypothetical protein n=1 Tax=Cognatiyoonia koreensis TaxID=364200 RepID=UPI000B7F0985|nr:hypothetical protein [Cognatiyoonia koreensis]